MGTPTNLKPEMEGNQPETEPVTPLDPAPEANKWQCPGKNGDGCLRAKICINGRSVGPNTLHTVYERTERGHCWRCARTRRRLYSNSNSPGERVLDRYHRSSKPRDSPVLL